MVSGNKLQRQKKGPWSLGERRVKVMCLGEERGARKGAGLLLEGRARQGPSSEGLLRMGILGEAPGENLNRIFIRFPGVFI